MKIFLDTNILLDNIDSTREGAEVSHEVVELCEKEENIGFISALGVANMMQVLKKQVKSRSERDLIVRTLCRCFEIVELERGDLVMATSDDFKDFDDGLHIMAAEKALVDCIVTRNVEHFEGTKVPVRTPEEILEEAKKS